jgi:capsular polysaccharide export protein
MIYAIYIKQIDFLVPLFISVCKTLQSNWYQCYFIIENNNWKKKLNDFDIKSIYLESDLSKYNISKIITWNWAYISNKLKENYDKIVYLENWYFPNTIQIDIQWVNSKSSYTNNSYHEILWYEKDYTREIKEVVIVNKIVKNKLDKIKWRYITNSSNIKLFTKKILDDFNELIKKFYVKFIKEIKVKKWKYVFIVFQVYDDTQLLFNSPIIRKMDDILDFFYKDIKKTLPWYKIIVKEHPCDVLRVNYKNLIEEYSDIIWIKKWNIDDIIEKSEYVITVNSSVWLQAISKYKKVLTLWECFYNNNPFSENLVKKEYFNDKLLILKDKVIKHEEVDKYINTFKEKIFIKWWCINFDKNTIKEISNFIINSFK